LPSAVLLPTAKLLKVYLVLTSRLITDLNFSGFGMGSAFPGAAFLLHQQIHWYHGSQKFISTWNCYDAQFKKFQHKNSTKNCPLKNTKPPPPYQNKKQTNNNDDYSLKKTN